MTPADLARVVHASYGRRTVGRLMPTSGTDRRVSAHALASRLRLERKLTCTEADTLAALSELARLGCVDRGTGGWAVLSWERLGEVGATSTLVLRRKRRALR